MKNMFRDLTVSSEETLREEETLRTRVRELPDEQRKMYYELSGKSIRDPDTYAVLNWMFVGLHHIYLGRWARGLLNLTIVAIGLLLVIIDLATPESRSVAGTGILMLVALAAVELLQLFRSQTIVADYNNQVGREILERVQASRAN